MGGKRERKGNGVVPVRARAHLEVLQVGVEELLEGGTLHLDRDALAVARRGEVHLAERGRGDRRLVKAGEGVLAHLLLHNLVGEIAVKGGHRVL